MNAENQGGASRSHGCTDREPLAIGQRHGALVTYDEDIIDSFLVCIMTFS